MGNVLTKIELHPNRIPDDLKKYFRPKRKYGTWIIRNLINWVKPNPMPSSAKDRFTVDFELVILMTKSKRYFFEPQYEPCLTESNTERPRMGQETQTKYNQKRGYGGGGTSFQGHSGNYKADGTAILNPLGRNRRTTWVIPTEAFPEAHFATFPRKLVEPMIRSGCPRYVCSVCGTPRRKVYETSSGTIGKSWIDHKRDIEAGMSQRMPELNAVGHTYKREYKGYSTCGCKDPKYRPGICLDPFAGSCTTAVVAHEHGRDYVMVELSPEYVKLGKKRLKKQTDKYGLLE